MPRPSVTAKIALISFMPTASSTDAGLLGDLPDLLPRRVLDRHTAGAPLALHPGFGLAGDQDLLRARRQRGRAYPVQQRRDLRVEIGQRQEAHRIDADHERAVAEHRWLAAGRAGAGEDAAEDLDRDRQAEALVGAGGEQRAGWLGVVLAPIVRRLAASVEHDAGRHRLPAVELHAQLALGPHAA